MVDQNRHAGNDVVPSSFGGSRPVPLIRRERPSVAAATNVHIVDDDELVREALGDLLRSMGYKVATYRSASDFLESDLPDSAACVILDVRMPGTSGLELQEYLNHLDLGLPVILMTAFGDIPMSVKCMKAGAVDFLPKPIRDQDLLEAVSMAIRISEGRRRAAVQATEASNRYATLTPRERQVVALVASGLSNKVVASELSISEVTVKMHRGSAMRKLGVRSVASLARMTDLLEASK
jgi:FixJ family two-component response regulator